jgi:integrase
MSKNTFPMVIKAGAVQVKIYRTETTRTRSGYLYQLAWHDGTMRQIKQFADLDDAKAEGRTKAEQLQAGRANESLMSMADIDMLSSIRELVGDHSPTEALREWLRARELCDGHLIEAAKFWKSSHATDFQRSTINEVVEAFKAAKAKTGTNVKKTYRGAYFDNLLKAFPNTPINRISSRELTRYLDHYENPSYRNTHRRRIVTLFRWAARQGYLPQNAKTQAELTDNASEAETTISIFTPDQFTAILEFTAVRYPQYLAALVLAGFCGMRRGEVHTQVWDDIDMTAGTVTVTKAKPRTPADRIIPLCQSALEWLLRCPDRTGAVCSNLAIDRIRKLAQDNELEAPQNGLRHSYISYQMALGNTAGQVAQWAGNTERQIHRHYRRPRPKSEAEEYFSLSPDKVLSNDKKVVSMGAGQ